MSPELEKLGLAIDAAADKRDKDSLMALDQQCVYLEPKVTGADGALLWYFRSNVHAEIQNIVDPRSWKWRQPHRERQLLYLRRARAHPGFDHLDRIRRAQITTNFANSLDSLGRGLEALEFYDAALKIQPSFAMALANRGYALKEFARGLYDRGHAALILEHFHCLWRYPELSR